MINVKIILGLMINKNEQWLMINNNEQWLMINNNEMNNGEC